MPWCTAASPKFTIPEILQDMNRAVRFIRFHASDYHIDPNHIGMTGASAGGHLSLMQGTAGDEGNPSASDPVDKTSSRIQAVACFYPPTDFLNFGQPGRDATKDEKLRDFAAPFQFTQWDPKLKVFVPITDPKTVHDIIVAISPLDRANKQTPPTLIFHGDADPLVPIQQSQAFIAKLKELNVPCELVVKKGGGHGWIDGIVDNFNHLCDWFDLYLK